MKKEKVFLSVELKCLLFHVDSLVMPACAVVKSLFLYVALHLGVSTACPSLVLAANLSYLLHVSDKDTEQ